MRYELLPPPVRVFLAVAAMFALSGLVAALVFLCIFRTQLLIPISSLSGYVVFTTGYIATMTLLFAGIFILRTALTPREEQAHIAQNFEGFSFPFMAYRALKNFSERRT